MCGIVGYWSQRRAPEADIVAAMASRIRARGPDGAGTWTDEAAGLALGHRRLAIIDLSEAGHQPMASPCGRFVLTYNGEIYNHLDMRAELDALGGGFDWRGHSDTETLLAALAYWGVEKALQKTNGMFAFALWDRVEAKLFLARDRMGEKPLYYGRNGGAFLFGSELKALAEFPDWSPRVDRDALTMYLRHSYVPSPHSIYEGIHKLPPAHYVVVGGAGTEVGAPRCYWSLDEVVRAGSAGRRDDAVALTEELEELLSDSVYRRMASDVPLGAFLSGGYDSTTVAALMQAQSSRPVKTFSIGFHEEGYNEAAHAKAIAQHLGTDHTELYVTPKEAMNVIPDLPEIYDEPFADSSQIPTHLVSRLARQAVTVSLSGDGGDELFCGYNRYVLGYRIWSKLRLLPAPLRKVIAAMLRAAPGHSLDALQRKLPPRMRVSNLADRLPKLAEVVQHESGADFYGNLLSHFKDPAQVVIGGNEPDVPMTGKGSGPGFSDFREQMMYWDMLGYLPDDILAKVDRASMAVSLESRMPLLDHRLIEFAWRVPIDLKYRNGNGKWLLREVLYKHVPRSLMDRPKMGFGVPIEHWLRGPLRDWAEDLLDESRLRQDGYFEPEPIRRIWNEHVSGERRWHYYLWDVLMFQAWLHGPSPSRGGA